VLALSEMEFPEARKELEYASPQLERTTKRARPASVYGKRRFDLASRVLGAL
jgi:hypothetical protein